MNLVFENQVTSLGVTEEVITLTLAEQGIQGMPGTSGAAAPPQSAEADQAIAPGQPIYLKANGRCALAVADAPDKARVAGFATNTAAIGFTCEYRSDGIIEGLIGLIPGSFYYLSLTPGQITQNPPTTGYIAPVGHALTSSKLEIKFHPIIRL